MERVGIKCSTCDHRRLHTCRIEKTSLTKPTISGTYTYNGSNQYVSLNNYDSSLMTISNNVQKNAGTYVVYISLRDTNSYEWSDGTTGTISLWWTINKKSVSITWGSQTTFVYNGSAQAPTASASSGISWETINVYRTTKVNVGSYTSTASVSSVTGGSISNYSITGTTKSFTIVKANISPAVTMMGYEYGKNKSMPSITGNSGNGTVTYYYSTQNRNTGGQLWSNVTSSTYLSPGAYWMYATVGATTNYNGGTTATIKFTVTRPPVISINSNTTYEKEQTATIKIYDPDKDLSNMDNEKYLRQGTIRLYYEWTQSAATPASFSSYVDISVGAQKSEVSRQISKNTGSGIWYLHVKATAYDAVGYVSNLSTKGTFYLDNIAPNINVNANSNIIYIGADESYNISINVTDIHSEAEETQLTADDVKVYIAGNLVNPTKSLSHISYNTTEKTRLYKLTLSNINATGDMELVIPSNAVIDKAGNGSSETRIGKDVLKVFVDYSKPEVTQNGETFVRSITTGKNLSGVIDPRYVNKEYEIVIPIQVIDKGTDVATNILETQDIIVKVDGVNVSPSTMNVVEKSITYSEDASSKVKTYTRGYELSLKGIENNGYLSIVVKAGAVNDFVGNKNDEAIFEPYTLYTGSDTRIYVDNTKPTIKLEAVNPIITNGETILDFNLKISDEGAGITDNQFIVDDIEFLIDGRTVDPAMKELIPSNRNNHSSALGGDVEENYSYVLNINSIDEEGVLRLRIAENNIIDKANNGIQVVTISPEVEIDRTGPTIGEIKSNADAYGRIVDEPVELTIDGCKDKNGIDKYEWQYSEDGVNWETIKVDQTFSSQSDATHNLDNDQEAHYRVIVYDTVGNSTTSKEAIIDYRIAMNKKPTMRFETSQVDGTKVDITLIIKSTYPIVSIVVNGNQRIDSSTFNVSKNVYEITTTALYTALNNGTYEFTAIDKNNNSVTEKINISTLKTSMPTITYTTHDATIVSKAKIEFLATEPVRIISPDSYAGITFDTTDFSTKIVATIDDGIDFGDSKIFVFENKSFVSVDVEVLGPILTQIKYLRFAGPVSNSMDVTMKEAYTLANSLPMFQVSINGKITCFYGFESKNINVGLATYEQIDVSETLGDATNIYSISANGDMVELTGVEEIDEPEMNSSYMNGNITGVSNCSKSGGLYTYNGSPNSDDTEYSTFRTSILR